MCGQLHQRDDGEGIACRQALQLVLALQPLLEIMDAEVKVHTIAIMLSHIASKRRTVGLIGQHRKADEGYSWAPL